MAPRSMPLSPIVRLHPARIPDDDLGALIRACVTVLREGEPARTFTDDLMEWATRDRLRRRDLQAREEGDTDEDGWTHPYGETARDEHFDQETPVNVDAWGANECDIVGFEPREPRLFILDPRALHNGALASAVREYHVGLVNLLGDRTGPHAKAITTWLWFGRVLLAEVGKRPAEGKR